MRHTLKITFAIVAISALSLAEIKADHHRSSGSRDDRNSERTAARTHSSSARSRTKASQNSHEAKPGKNKTKGRATTDRDRARNAAKSQRETMFPPPSVDLPRHENGTEEDSESDENSSR